MIVDLQSSNTKNIIAEQKINMERIIVEQVERIIGEVQNIAPVQIDTRPTTKTIAPSFSTDSDSESSVERISGSRHDLQVSRRQSTFTSRYQSLLGTLYIRRTKITISTNHDDEEMIKKSALTQTRSSFTFFPTFLSRCIDI
jgi:hypothetical protein